MYSQVPYQTGHAKEFNLKKNLPSTVLLVRRFARMYRLWSGISLKNLLPNPVILVESLVELTTIRLSDTCSHRVKFAFFTTDGAGSSASLRELCRGINDVLI
jgi:hypothetical protein